MDAHPADPRRDRIPRKILLPSAAFVTELEDAVERWELCAFNNLCRDKYRRLDMDWAYNDYPLLEQADLEQAGEWARLAAA